MPSLRRHCDSLPGPVQTVDAKIAKTDLGCRARFRLEGDMTAVVVPPPSAGRRLDDLWKTTCLEIFWQREGKSSYREFNLSPSGDWAAYDFDDVRTNICRAPVEAITIACVGFETGLTLECDVAADLDMPARIALNAVVEDTAGNIQFWALAFADGPANFHSPACRALKLETSS